MFLFVRHRQARGREERRVYVPGGGRLVSHEEVAQLPSPGGCASQCLTTSSGRRRSGQGEIAACVYLRRDRKPGACIASRDVGPFEPTVLSELGLSRRSAMTSCWRSTAGAPTRPGPARVVLVENVVVAEGVGRPEAVDTARGEEPLVDESASAAPPRSPRAHARRDPVA